VQIPHRQTTLKAQLKGYRMTLQERLKQPIKTVHEERQPDSVKVMWNLGDKTVQDLAQAIEKDILELLPEKQKASDMWHRNKSKGMKASEAIALTDAYNEALEDVRLKLKKYMKGTE